MKHLEKFAGRLSPTDIRHKCRLSRDLAYAIVHRLPHNREKNCGPYAALSVNIDVLENCLKCIEAEKLLPHDVFIKWSVEEFETWWANCQSPRENNHAN